MEDDWSSRPFGTTIDYRVYFSNDTFQELSENETNLKLETYVLQLNAFALALSHEFLWQKDSLRLHVGRDKKLPRHLFGKSRFSDSLIDEWMVVYILYKISENFPETIIQTTDWCGDFILIETAEHVPKKLQDPATTLNRLFIARGALRFIPLSASQKRNISMAEALILYECLQENVTLAPHMWQQTISAKIEPYSRGFSQFQHKVKCFIPRKIAKLLYYNRNLISDACEAYCTCELPNTQKMRKVTHFSVFHQDNDIVLTTITMNRISFLQLLSKDLCLLPELSVPSTESPDHKAKILGLKIALGFDILLFKYGYTFEENPTVKSLHDDTNWLFMRGELEKTGYFSLESKGSDKYEKKDQFAKFAYHDMMTWKNRNISNDSLDSYSEKDFIDQITTALSKPDVSEAVVSEEESSLEWLDEYCAEKDEGLHRELYALLKKEEDRKTDRTKKMVHNSRNVEHQCAGSDTDNDDDDDDDDNDDDNSEDFYDYLDAEERYNSEFYENDSNSNDESTNSEDVSDEDIDFDIGQKLSDRKGDIEPMLNKFLSSKSGLKGVESKKSMAAKKSKKPQVKNAMTDYLEQLENEMSSLITHEDFERKNIGNNEKEIGNVDMGFNFVKNMVDSMQDAGSLSGPYRTFLSQMGFKLDDDTKNFQPNR